MLKCYSFPCGGTAGHSGRVRTADGGGRSEERGAPAWSVAPLFSLLDLRFRPRRVLPAPPAARSHERYLARLPRRHRRGASCGRGGDAGRSAGGRGGARPRLHRRRTAPRSGHLEPPRLAGRPRPRGVRHDRRRLLSDGAAGAGHGGGRAGQGAAGGRIANPPAADRPGGLPALARFPPWRGCSPTGRPTPTNMPGCSSAPSARSSASRPSG